MKYFNHNDINLGELLGSGQFSDFYEAYMSSFIFMASLSLDEDEDKQFVLKQIRINQSTKDLS